jgi:NADPH2:quinone reductase
MQPSHGLMRAWLSKEVGLKGLVLESMPRPQTKPGEILVAVEAAALNFSDLLMLEDKYQLRPTRPFVPGQEIAGTVVACGPDSRLKRGDKVASEIRSGGFAEFAAVREDMAIRIDDSVDIAHAAVLSVTYTTALIGLTECTALRPDETVLIHGAAGGVGLAALQIAKSLGARVIATASRERKLDLARRNGADHVIDYTRSGWKDRIDELTNGCGVNVVFDPVGGEVTRESIRCLAWGGRLLIVGFASGQIPDIPANRLLLKRASALGVYWDHVKDAPMMARVNSRLNELLRAGAIAPLIDGRYALENLVSALEQLSGRSSVGKLVLRVRH